MIEEPGDNDTEAMRELGFQRLALGDGDVEMVMGGDKVDGDVEMVIGSGTDGNDGVRDGVSNEGLVNGSDPAACIPLDFDPLDRSSAQAF